MPGSILSPNQRAQYDQDGYIMVRKLFDDEEIAILRTAIENDASMRSRLYDRNDSSGKSTRMATWNVGGRAGTMKMEAKLPKTATMAMTGTMSCMVLSLS